MKTSPIKEEIDAMTTQTKSRRQVLEDHATVKDMKETFKELNLTDMTSIPNSYIYQPDPEYRKWTSKRGKKSYFDSK